MPGITGCSPGAATSVFRTSTFSSKIERRPLTERAERDHSPTARAELPAGVLTEELVIDAIVGGDGVDRRQDVSERVGSHDALQMNATCAVDATPDLLHRLAMSERVGPDKERKIVEKLGLRDARRHIFLCCDQPKPKCCDRDRSLKAWDYLKKRLRQLGLSEQRRRAAQQVALPAHLRERPDRGRLSRGRSSRCATATSRCSRRSSSGT